MMANNENIITKEMADYIVTKEYQAQLTLAYDEEARGYDDACPNEENDQEVG